VTFRISPESAQTVELRNLPYEAWPNEAKAWARQIMDKPSMLAELRRQISPREWLVTRIERVQAAHEQVDALLANRAAQVGRHSNNQLRG
jgi:hypothetical protein